MEPYTDGFRYGIWWPLRIVVTPIAFVVAVIALFVMLLSIGLFAAAVWVMKWFEAFPEFIDVTFLDID